MTPNVGLKDKMKHWMRAVYVVALFLCGCVTDSKIHDTVARDESEIVERYRIASTPEKACLVLNDYLAIADDYDKRGWNRRGIRTDAIRSVTEARLSVIAEKQGRVNEAGKWISLAVAHRKSDLGSVEVNPDLLKRLVNKLDERIDPEWRKHVGQPPPRN